MISTTSPTFETRWISAWAMGLAVLALLLGSCSYDSALNDVSCDQNGRRSQGRLCQNGHWVLEADAADLDTDLDTDQTADVTDIGADTADTSPDVVADGGDVQQDIGDVQDDADAGCPGGMELCDGQCVDLQADTEHCGACGNACNLENATPICVAGECVIDTCTESFDDCDDNPVNGCEVDLSDDASNCGECNNACDVSSAMPVCVNSSCSVGQCNGTFEDCDGEDANGCEINLDNNTQNCGSCGMVCDLPNANENCSSGDCEVDTCEDGFADCDSEAPGCETDTSDDLNNCGSCGNTCNLAHATPMCSNGGCAITSCEGDFADCNSNPMDGCEVNLNNETDHCGSCGNTCNLAHATSMCSNSGCAIASCDLGFDDCNNDPTDGCEVNLNGNADNCGSCGNTCNLAHATPMCSNGSCAIAACEGDFADCNVGPTDGCEVNLNNNTDHCGACGMPCNLDNATATCSNASCAIDSCDPGFRDCNSNPVDGCEQTLQTFYPDNDGDSFGDEDAQGQKKCMAGPDEVQDNTDCDDNKASAYPGAAGNDINSSACMLDSDGDGYGDKAPDNGDITAGTDCKDDDYNINPGAPEICDGRDNNCDGNDSEPPDDDPPDTSDNPNDVASQWCVDQFLPANSTVDLRCDDDGPDRGNRACCEEKGDSNSQCDNETICDNHKDDDYDKNDPQDPDGGEDCNDIDCDGLPCGKSQVCSYDEVDHTGECVSVSP